MKVETEETDEGTWIEVKAREPAAVSVVSDGKETIYLPSDGSDTTYYVEKDTVEEIESGFKVFHTAKVDSVELLSSSW